MKKFLFLSGLLIIANWCLAQTDPVKWSFSAKKIQDKIYEITLSAKVDRSWHIYSQGTPDGGPSPTVVTFAKNPLVTLSGKIKEVGTMLQKHEEVFGVDVRYYNDEVKFVQVIKLKSPVKTNISGTVSFMACTDEQCLPPQDIPFSIKL